MHIYKLVCIWKAALDEDLQNMNPIELGWNKYDLNKILVPVTVPSKIHGNNRDVLIPTLEHLYGCVGAWQHQPLAGQPQHLLLHE